MLVKHKFSNLYLWTNWLCRQKTDNSGIDIHDD